MLLQIVKTSLIKQNVSSSFLSDYKLVNESANVHQIILVKEIEYAATEKRIYAEFKTKLTLPNLS